ncbi:hypothetical protein EPA93_05895 [Ktedonosporobacter rubrisoli]|uniref:Glycosyl hydrolase family 32 N-terminal domain-containing protein n=1 Tax=Ktedonosporobacter rubrisoli TaxID=2509675 RepID=A0A4P6JKP7_KTERU|nr:hypothetical protein [Ktedonosporobacter rubrisoli]QBD75560.1 hypothetical protein EPA93_05895 [Ktedonosporobacter rubrisoli]
MDKRPTIQPMEKIKLFDTETGEGMGGITNLTTIGLGSIVKRNNQWEIFLGGREKHSKIIHTFSATLPPDESLSSTNWTIQSFPQDPTVAEPLAASPAPTAWDATGFHCPSYVRGWDPTLLQGAGAWQERIYYASCREWNMAGPYAIGFLEWDGVKWKRYGEPVLQASEPWEFSSVQEPNVIYYEGKWRMWYCAGPNEAQHYLLGYAESEDGKSAWKNRKIFFSADGFDACVLARHDRFDMLLARLYLTPTYQEARDNSGLWWLSASHLAEALEQWSEPIQILKANDGTPWHNGGVWKPTFHYDDVSRKFYVFFDANCLPKPGAFFGNLTVGRLAFRVLE